MRHQFGGHLRGSIILLLAVLLTPAAISLAQQGPGRMPMMRPGMPEIKYVAPRPITEPVASTKLGKLTIADLQKAKQTEMMEKLMFVPQDKVAALPDDMLRDAAAWVAARWMAFDDAQKTTDSQKKAQFNANMGQGMDKVIINHLIRTEIMDKVTSPTQQEIKAFYDQHQPSFKVPFNFTMRHLLLQTYEPYVVQEGDTLESIAERISGNPAQAANIRSDVPSRPPRREDGKSFKALMPGEKLLVPMSEEKSNEVKQKLEDLVKQLKPDGSNIQDLIKQVNPEAAAQGDEPIGPLPSGTKPMLPELLEMAKKTPAGKVSPIFQTKHGWQVIKVESKTEEHIQPLDAATREQIAMRLRQQRSKEMTDLFLDKLFKQPGFKIDYSLFAKGDRLSTDTVVGSVGKFTIRWNDVKPIWEEKGKPSNKDLIMKMVLYNAPPFFLPLSRQWVQPLLQDPQSTLSQAVKWVQVAYVGSQYLRAEAVRRVEAQIEQHPEEVKAYYEKHKTEPQFKNLAKVKYELLAMKLGDDASKLTGDAKKKAQEELKASLGAQLAKVKSAKDFENLAAQVDRPLRDTGKLAEPLTKPIDVSAVDPAIAQELAKLKPGQWSPPFAMGGEMVASALLQERQDESTKPLDEVSSQVKDILASQLFPGLMAQVEADWTRRADFKWLLTPVAAKQ